MSIFRMRKGMQGTKKEAKRWCGSRVFTSLARSEARSEVSKNLGPTGGPSSVWSEYRSSRYECAEKPSGLPFVGSTRVFMNERHVYFSLMSQKLPALCAIVRRDAWRTYRESYAFRPDESSNGFISSKNKVLYRSRPRRS